MLVVRNKQLGDASVLRLKVYLSAILDLADAEAIEQLSDQWSVAIGSGPSNLPMIQLPAHRRQAYMIRGVELC